MDCNTLYQKSVLKSLIQMILESQKIFVHTNIHMYIEMLESSGIK